MRSSPRSQPLSRAGLLCTALSLGIGSLGGCGETVQVGFDDALGLGPGGLGGDGAGATPSTGGDLMLGGVGPGLTGGDGATAGEASACETTACRGEYYECGDCIDNDADGAIDTLDPECIGPCDDDETGFSTGLKSNGGNACRQDCYFDGDNGVGNDKCEWSLQCDPLSIAPDYPPSGEARCAYDGNGQGKGEDCAALAASQPATCLDNCLPLAPNGCDCFGCCELPSRSGEYHFIGKGRGSEGCQLDALDDAAACPRCTPVTGCMNDCAPCEVCVGGGLDPSCQAAECSEGHAACSPESPCDFGDYCVTGCCVRAPVR